MTIWPCPYPILANTAAGQVVGKRRFGRHLDAQYGRYQSMVFGKAKLRIPELCLLKVVVCFERKPRQDALGHIITGMKALSPFLRIQDREKRRLDGLPGRLMSSIIAFVAVVPALAYLAYLELKPAIVISLTVIVTPLAMIVAQQYLSSLERLYGSYRSAIVATNDWLPLLGDMSLTAAVGFLSYFAVRNLAAGSHVLPLYVGFISVLAYCRQLKPSSEKPAH
jgi:hypothetical protein